MSISAKSSFLLILCFFLNLSTLFAQQAGNPFITNHQSKDYHASPSNWDITQSKEGIIFAANLEGVLAYNTQFWKFNTANSGVFSISLDNDNRIYFGTTNDFGYLSIKNNQILKITSLPKQYLPDQTIDPIWSITPCNQKTYFTSKTNLYEWDGQSLKSISKKLKMHPKCIENKLYFIEKNKGLIFLENEKLSIVKNTQSLTEELLLYLDTGGKYGLFIGTKQSGFYKYKKNQLNKVKSFDTSQIISPFRITAIAEKFSISSLTNGLTIADTSFSKQEVINKSSGLQSNSIKKAFVDGSNNIWTANQQGISYIEYGSPWRKYLLNQISGSITSFQWAQNNLFIGTTEGLYKKDQANSLVNKEIDSRIWDLSKSILNKKKIVIAAGDNGIDAVTNVIENKLSYLKAQKSKVYNDTLIVLHNEGINIYNDQLALLHTIKLTDHAFSDLNIDKTSTIWATAKYKGIYQIKNIGQPNESVKLFNTENGLPDVTENFIIDVNQQTLFTTSKGLYQYKPENVDSLKFVSYGRSLNPLAPIRNVTEDKDGNFYFALLKNKTDQLVKYELQPNGEYQEVSIPYKRLPDMQITALHASEDSVLWVGGSEGLFSFDAKIKKDYTLPYYTLINQVYTTDSLLFGGFYNGYTEDNSVPYLTTEQPENKIPYLEFENNNLIFEYAAAFYELPEKTRFSYYLENNDKKWSDWSSQTRKEYTNLPAGNYTFHVKAKNIYEHEGKVASYSFNIIPPWYQTSWATILFVIVGLLFIWFITLAYTFRIRQQRRHLKLLVADRTHKVRQQKQEIETQNDQLKIKNQEITINRDKIVEANKKMQRFQNEILTANEELQELNESLEEKVSTRTAKIKQTLKKLQKVNTELDTFIYRASHDLKGPISRIHGLASLAKLEMPDADKKYYDLIEYAAQDMRGLLNKLSNAYDIMNLQVVKEEIDLPFILSEIRNNIRFLENNTQYHFDLKNQFTLVHDEYIIKLIIENLIENALIFRKKVAGNHNIYITSYEEDGYFYFKIKDDGIGVEPSQFDKIFGMFYRGSDQSKGSGLGLYIVKMATEKIKGEVTVESTLYENSTFTIKLPI